MKGSYLQITLAAVITFFSLSACNNKDADSHQNDTKATDHATEQHVGHESSVVQLNHGERWQANPETLQGIGDMLEMTNAYISGRQTDVQVLKSELDSRFQLIFTECTMTGEAHEQLHAYLIPIKGMLEGLNQDSGDETVKELNDYLRTFDDYFM
jgi:hypothetical protein